MSEDPRDLILGAALTGPAGAGHEAPVALVVALGRAGALGVLDLVDETGAAAAMAAIGARTDAPFAIRPAPALAAAGEAALASPLPAAATTVVLDAGTLATLGVLEHPGGLARLVATWGGRRVLVEVTSVEGARAAVDAGAAGLVAKGAESGGLVGDTESFVLLQQVVGLGVPVWARGGIGRHTAAAAIALGAAGVFLDVQLSLVRESRLPSATRRAIEAMDGSETRLVGGHRVFTRPDLPVASRPADDAPEAVRADLGTDVRHHLVPVGQDAPTAVELARVGRTAGGVVALVREAVAEHLAAAAEHRPLAPGNGIAARRGVPHPIAQGPMTRVSDTAAFAAAVADGGGLPFLALALLRGQEVDALLRETAEAVGDRPWGVGILGFVPPELREEQLAVVQAVAPPVALIAGGRPSQAAPLDDAGIATFLHVPSPGLLDRFVKDGARRFVFEGRECGGHVGPRPSFPLWDAQIERLLAVDDPEHLEVLFAGGVHDAASAAAVAAAAAPLAARGAAVGVLMGTAYLFTKEAVAAGAIVPAFQDAAVACERTVLLETSPGHATRCVESDYVRAFQDAKAAMETDGTDPKAMWAELEALNLGRLRLASKGLTHGTGPDGEHALVAVAEPEQRREGMYMIGQVAALRHEVTTVAELHAEVSEGATERIEELAGELAGRGAAPDHERTPPPLEVAIVGMASLFPGATSPEELWSMVLAGANAVTEVPPERWDVERYYDPSSTTVGAGEKTPSKWGGFLPPVGFDPLAYGIPPASLAAVEPVQLLSLEVAARALADAGYAERPFDRSRASVVFGAESGNDLSAAYGLRAVLPQLFGEVPPELDAHLPRLTEDSFPGVLTNVIAGRIANRLDLGGVNYTVDAACAASLAAVDAACKELVSGNSDLVLCGGADVHNGLNDYLLFSSVHALSPTGQCRTFDAAADGIALGEGIACLVLKRLADAERDGDRVYAVIDAVAGSSDGRHLGLTAPRKEGQQRALRRAYAQARRSPAELGLVEAHGTGTVVGDRTELATLTEVFAEHGAEVGGCVLGSVKSQIGHTKCAAGLAGLVKAARAVYHGVLPPTGNLVEPNPAYDAATSPFRFLHEPRPWIGPARRAGVSAFGFGGANFHAVLSSHDADDGPSHGLDVWPAELFLVRAEHPDAAVERLEQLSALVEAIVATDPTGERHPLRELARTVSDAARGPVQVAIVANDLHDLADKLVVARSGTGRRDGVFLRADVPDEVLRPDDPGATHLAFLHPGQGSQRPGMLADLFVAFPRLRPLLDAAEPWLPLLFPPAAFGAEERRAQAAAVTDTRVAQPLLGLGGLAVTSLLGAAGVHADAAGGHSYGELVALATAGALEPATLLGLSQARGEAIVASAAARGDDPGAMAAVNADIDTVRTILGDRRDVVVANHNGPDQVVISGATEAVDSLVASLGATGIGAKRINVACAFHSPLLADAPALFGEHLDGAPVGSPSIPVYANATAAPYPADPDAVRAGLRSQLTSEVRFVEQVEAMYAAGVRVFVEAGPGRVLTQLVAKVLGDRPHRAVACDVSGEPGIRRFLLALGELAATGLEVDTDVLFEGRAATVSLADLPRRAPGWVLDGHLARTADGSVVPGSLQPASAFPAPAGRAWGGAAGGTDAGGEREATVLEYLRSVREVVAAEREVMLRYLGAPADALGAIDARVVEPVAPGAPLAAPPAAVAGTNGHTTTAAPRAAVPRGDELLAVVLQIVADRTGYPTDMLDPDLDLEADLSIDSIKRIEIIGELAERIGLDPTGGDGTDALGDEAIEALAGLKTLREVVGFLDPLLAAAAPAAVAGTNGHTTTAAPRAAVPRGDELLAVVLQIVADRTGYPTDMLDPDLDLEADLSIDSIKRIEIIGELAERIGLDPTGGDGTDALGDEAIEALAGLKTLREVVSWIDGLDAGAGAGAAPAGGPGAEIDLTEGPAVPDRPLRVTWRRVELDAPPPGAVAQLAGRSVLVADDHGGVAPALAALLHDAGARVEVVDTRTPPSDTHHAAITGADTVVWLAALDPEVGDDPSRADARAAFAWWQPAVLAATTTLLVATPGGGAFAGPGLGLGAMAKTIARELGGVATRAVDVDPAAGPGALAALVLAELADLAAGSGSAPVEVAYDGPQRTTRVPVVDEGSAPAPSTTTAGRVALGPDSVVVLTGGARGITALAAVEIARRHGCHIELLGRSPLPVDDEAADTAGAADRPALRRALLESGRATSPAEVEAECTRLLAAREVRATLAALADAGVEARYHRVDVTDVAALADTLREITGRHGRIDLVVHGAGVLDDRFIRDKSADGFGRVFATKVDAARTIFEHTADDTAVVLFGSVSGAFGNRGQIDYSAANAALDELAASHHRARPQRALAVDWGPWAGTGMVSPELEREYARRGIGLVDPAHGVSALLDELASPPDTAQVVVMRAAPAAMAPELSPWSPALDRVPG